MSGRHAFLRFGVIGLIAMTLFGSGRAASVHEASANTSDLSSVALPGDMGQTSLQAFVPQTGHTVRGYLLDYWRANGAASVYGNPISEPYASDDGYYSQAFEGGIFQFLPDLVWTDSPSVELQNVTQSVLNDRAGTFRRDGRRASGGGDRRSYSWRDLNPNSSSVTRAVNNGQIYSEATGQTVTGAFYDWYTSHEGYAYLGNPISQPLEQRGVVVQYFQGAELMRDSTGTVSVVPMIRENADRLGIDTTPVEQAGLPDYDETMFWKADNPNPIAGPYTPGRKWIEVSISQETLWAYQGDTLVSTTLVSTGIEPNHTEQGLFHVRYKLESQDMQGTINSNGAVDAMGEDAADAARQGRAPGETAYLVKDVPNVMYFDSDAEALHGAYWHNNFGHPMSHGCVNLPLDFAAFLFGWAPLGTEVWVHE